MSGHRSYGSRQPSTYLNLREPVCRDLNGDWPDICIRSDKARAAKVLDILHQTWVSGGDIMVECKEAVKAADIANAMVASGEPLPEICQCQMRWRILLPIRAAIVWSSLYATG